MRYLATIVVGAAMLLVVPGGPRTQVDAAGSDGTSADTVSVDTVSMSYASSVLPETTQLARHKPRCPHKQKSHKGGYCIGVGSGIGVVPGSGLGAGTITGNPTRTSPVIIAPPTTITTFGNGPRNGGTTFGSNPGAGVAPGTGTFGNLGR